MNHETLVMLISESLNESKFWLTLDRKLRLQHDIEMDTDELYVAACDIEEHLASLLLEYIENPY